MSRFVVVAVLAVGCVVASVCSSVQAEVKPPAGFKAIFNGRDLQGWYGAKDFNPRKLAAMSAEERKAHLDKNQPFSPVSKA